MPSIPVKILLIDNHDSFTYNLLHSIKKVKGTVVTVKKNDEIGVDEPESYDKIIFSPGPGIPEEAGLMLEIIRKYSGKKPMLGICLGHQAIAETFGCKLLNMNDVLHGISSPVTVIADSYLFDNLPSEFNAGRYHSWIVDKDTLPSSLEVTGIDQDGNIMSFQHKKLDIQGVQFHPESILTPFGDKIIENWVRH
jgi:anthranilate synthase component 2